MVRSTVTLRVPMRVYKQVMKISEETGLTMGDALEKLLRDNKNTINHLRYKLNHPLQNSRVRKFINCLREMPFFEFKKSRVEECIEEVFGDKVSLRGKIG